MQYNVRTTMLASQVLDQIMAHFGPQGKGLTPTSQYKRALRLQDQNGYIEAIVKSEKPTCIEIETRAWERAVEQFIAQLPRERSWWQRLRYGKRPSPSATAQHA